MKLLIFFMNYFYCFSRKSDVIHPMLNNNKSLVHQKAGKGKLGPNKKVHDNNICKLQPVFQSCID
jgi:hypothetical protein